MLIHQNINEKKHGDHLAQAEQWSCIYGVFIRANRSRIALLTIHELINFTDNLLEVVKQAIKS